MGGGEVGKGRDIHHCDGHGARRSGERESELATGNMEEGGGGGEAGTFTWDELVMELDAQERE